MALFIFKIYINVHIVHTKTMTIILARLAWRNPDQQWWIWATLYIYIHVYIYIYIYISHYIPWLAVSPIVKPILSPISWWTTSHGAQKVPNRKDQKQTLRDPDGSLAVKIQRWANHRTILGGARGMIFHGYHRGIVTPKKVGIWCPYIYEYITICYITMDHV